MNSLIQMLSNSKKFNSYIEDILNKKSPVMITGLTDVSKMYFAYGTKEYTKKSICIITYNEIQAKKLLQDISYFTDKVVFIPKREILTYDYVAESKDIPYERIESLNKIYTNKADIVITTIEALMQPMIPKSVLYKDILEFKIGNSYKLEEVKSKLVNLGYKRCELIEGRGQFSIRGGIIDISISDKKGVRVELWGDEVDGIRYFNIISQRSTEMIKEIKIYPSHEFVLEKHLEKICKDIEDKIDSDKYKDNIIQDIELINSGNYISKIDKYFNSFYNTTTNLLDYITNKFVMFLDEASKIKARSQNLLIDNQNIQKMLTEKNKIIPESIEDIKEYDQIICEILKRQTVYLEKQDIGFIDENIAKAKRNAINFELREVNFYKSSMELFLEQIRYSNKRQKNSNSIRWK